MDNRPANIYTTKKCPICNSKEIEITEKYNILKRSNEWSLYCRNCNYQKTQYMPF